MRSLEIVLVVVTAAAAMSLPLLRRRTLPAIALCAVMLTAALQLIVEHPRIQLMPAYVLVMTVVGLLALRIARGERVAGRRPRWRTVAVPVVGGVAALALAGLTVVAASVFPVWSMPEPTGTFAVGGVDREFVDDSRPETHTTDTSDARRVMTTIWYPVEPDLAAGRPTEHYPRELGSAISSVFDLPDAMFSHTDLVSMHVVTDAPPAASDELWPVIVFSPGVSSTRFQSMVMVEELVSRGFVVVGVDHPYTSNRVSFPDGTVADAADDVTDRGTSEADEYAYNVSEVGIRVDDVAFVLDELAASPDLAARLDLDAVGIVGHSFGGATAIQALATDDRLVAGLSLEGGFWGSVTSTGVDKPFSYLASAATVAAFRAQDESAGYTPQLASDFASTLARSSTVSAAEIDGFVHQSFTDLALVSPVLFAGGMEAAHNVDTTRTQAAWFFEKHLRDDDSGAFGTGSAAYPEVKWTDMPGELLTPR